MSNSKMLLVLSFILLSLISKSEIRGQKLQQGSSWIRAVIFTSDAKSLISASDNGTLVNWDLKSGKQNWKLDLDDSSKTKNIRTVSRITDLSISPKRNVLAISYSQSTIFGDTAKADDLDRITLIDIKSGEILKTLASSSSIGKIVFSPQEDILLSFMDGGAYLWDINTEQKILEIKLKGGGANVVFSPDGKQIAIAMGPIWETPASSIVGLYETKTGKLLREFPREYSEVTGIEFSPNGKFLLIGGFKMPDVITKVWNLELPNNQNPRIILAEDKTLAENYHFSPDGKLIAYSTLRNGKPAIVLREFYSNKIIRTFKADSEIESLDFSPDGKQLAYGTRNGQIVIRTIK